MLVNYDSLKAWSDINQRNKLIEWLQKNQIAYHLNRHGNPVTTMTAVDSSLNPTKPTEKVDF